MLCFDANLLADYLDGHEPAETFLERHDTDVWATPSLALFEAYMGALVGRPRGALEDVYDATRGLEILPVTDDTALTAARLQKQLRDDGTPLSYVDAVIAGAARERGAIVGTSDEAFWSDAVKERVDVAEYHR